MMMIIIIAIIAIIITPSSSCHHHHQQQHHHLHVHMRTQQAFNCACAGIMHFAAGPSVLLSHSMT